MKLSTGGRGGEMDIWKHLAKVGILGSGIISQGKWLSAIDRVFLKLPRQRMKRELQHGRVPRLRGAEEMVFQ